jgi:anti-sigma B factor antagonist
MPAFAITEHPIDGVGHVLAVRGELDLFNASELKEAFARCIDAGRIRIIVDLAETTFVDSSGLSVLMAACKRLRSRGGTLAMVNLNETIARILQITGLDQTFTILPTREAAIDAVAAADAA